MKKSRFDFTGDSIKVLFNGKIHDSLRKLAREPQRFGALSSSAGAVTLEKMLVCGLADREKNDRQSFIGTRHVIDRPVTLFRSGRESWMFKDILVRIGVKHHYIITLLGLEALHFLENFQPTISCKRCKLRVPCVVSQSKCLRELWYVDIPFKINPTWLEYFQKKRW